MSIYTSFHTEEPERLTSLKQNYVIPKLWELIKKSKPSSTREMVNQYKDKLLAILNKYC